MEKRESYSVNSTYYQPPQPAHWQGRIDGTEPEHLRWHQQMAFVDLSVSPVPDLTDALVLLGFACDEGVRRNNGRLGARTGPKALRNALANLPPNHLPRRLYDAGDITCPNGDLEAAQDQLAWAVTTILKAGGFPILLGGGHEITYGHYQGIWRYTHKPVGIINFDAHFDNRSPQNTGSSSGTGFWQIAEAFRPRYGDFDYLVIGIQTASNTQALFATAEKTGTRYILAGDFHANRQTQIHAEVDGILQRGAGIYLTIDLDVFAAAHAPGVSAPAYNGIVPDHVFFDCLDRILDSGRVVAVDLAELNPEWDIDNRTARLAASIIHHITGRL